MRIAALTLCVAYWGLLTVLLLTSDPARLVGLHSVPWFPFADFGIHLTAFVGLSLVVHTTSWPKRPRWYMLACLCLYAVTTELMQSFVPHRTCAPTDAVANFLGIAIGTGIYWTVVHFVQPLLQANLAAKLVHMDNVIEGETF
jgi:VanZ family protein